MKASLITFLLIAALLCGCTGPESTPQISGSQLDPYDARRLSAFEYGDCPLDDQFVEFYGPRLRCGSLEVPEDRANPDSRTIKLPVMIYKAQGEAPEPDPILTLFYGPGATLNFSMAFPYVFSLMGEDHDFISIEQRGTGFSEPAMTCPELRDAYYRNLSLDPYSEEVRREMIELQQVCVDRWRNEGIRLESYNSQETVQDLEDLRMALDIEQWNLFAAGYGSRVAMMLMQAYPKTIRSVVLDAVGPLRAEGFAEQGQMNEQVLDRFFQLCARDQSCGETYPNLKEKFYHAVDLLNQSPAIIEVADLNSGARYNVFVDGYRLIDVTLAMTATAFPEFFPEMPKMIYQVENGQEELLAKMLGRVLPFFEPNPHGLASRVNCLEILPADAVPRLRSANLKLETAVGKYLNRGLETYLETCALWSDERPAGSLEPVRSDIPILLLVPELSQLSSPAWAKDAVKRMEQAYVVEVKDGISFGYNFGVPASACSEEIAEAFIIDPDKGPQSECAGRERKFLWITMQ